MPKVEIIGDNSGKIYTVEMQQREELNFKVSKVTENDTLPNSTIVSKDYSVSDREFSVSVLCPDR